MSAQAALDFVEGYLPEDEPLLMARRNAADVGGAPPVSPATGAVLRFIAASVSARSVVEIGTGCGTSGIWLLRGMRADGVLTSVDVDPEHQRLARKAFVAAGFAANRYRLIGGKAADVLVDVATLTGAARVALGGVLGALYATDDGLAAALLAAGADAGEPLWRMPLVDDYGDALESPVADLANVPHSSRPRAGSIEAALFLREFTGGRPWAHLDIAGAARSAPDGDEAKGATGFGTRVLLAWLGGLSPA